tara:strand:+ start:1978 stop:2526 length:549 start_codon:yes stop_codon:yes gene_type:complete
MALKIDNKIHLSWDDIQRLTDILSKKIMLECPQIESVTGLARGGLIPAVIISHKLNLPYVSNVFTNTLVIDDICDSGKTLEEAPGLYHAVLHYKPHTSSFVPTLWAEEMGDEWIVYPWERSDAAPIQDYLQSDEFKEFADWVDEPGPWPEEDDKIHTIGGLTNDKEGSFMKFQNKINKKDNE